jgi:hypothetical protein
MKNLFLLITAAFALTGCRTIMAVHAAPAYAYAEPDYYDEVPMAPASEAELALDFWFYPELNIYFSAERHIYFVCERSVWREVRSLPPTIVLSGHDHIVVREPMHRPWARNTEHHRLYGQGPRQEQVIVHNNIAAPRREKVIVRNNIAAPRREKVIVHNNIAAPRREKVIVHNNIEEPRQQVDTPKKVDVRIAKKARTTRQAKVRGQDRQKITDQGSSKEQPGNSAYGHGRGQGQDEQNYVESKGKGKKKGWR